MGITYAIFASTNVQHLHAALDVLNLQQLVNVETCPKSAINQGSIIDLIFTNTPNLFTIVCIQPGFGSSDHNDILCHIVTGHKAESVSWYIYQYNKADWNILCDTLNRIHWNTFFWREHDINDAWDTFQELLLAVIKDVATIAEQSGKRQNPWITHEIVILSKRKHSTFKAHNRHPNSDCLWTKICQHLEGLTF